MIDNRFLIGAIALMLIIIVRDILKKYTNVDMDKIDMIKVFKYCKRWLFIHYKKLFEKRDFVMKRSTGNNLLFVASVGDNKATFMATLRQITGITYDHAKWIADSAPTVFMTGLSDDEANLNKKALEFVGAKIEIKK